MDNSSPSSLSLRNNSTSRTPLEKLESSDSPSKSGCRLHPAPALQRQHFSLFLFSVITIVLSSPLIALGTFLGIHTISVSTSSACGQDCWQLNPLLWDTAFAFYGSVLGATGAMLLQELVASMAQRQLVTDRKVTLRMFRRLGLVDVFHVLHSGNWNFARQRSWALPILAATYLTSSAAVGLVGTHTVQGTTRNALGSATMNVLNDTLFYNDITGAMFPDTLGIDPSNFDGPVVKAATIISLQALGKYDKVYAETNDLYLGGKIGNSTYEDIDTAGIGVNVDSYLHFIGDGDIYSPPKNYTFNKLTGVAWGLNTTAQCVPTDVFNITRLSKAFGLADSLTVYNVSGPGYNLVFSSLMETPQPYAFTVLSPSLALQRSQISSTQWVTLAVIIPTWMDSTTFAYMCSFSAEQYLASISVSGVGGALQYAPLSGPRKDISGPLLSQTLSSFLQPLINVRIGTAIMNAMGRQIIDPTPAVPIEGVLSQILSAATRMRMTLIKQHYERSSASIPGVVPDQTFFELEYSLQRMGSGRSALYWLFLPILLFLTGFGGFLVAMLRGETAIVDVADPVAVSAVMIGSRIPELEGRSSGNLTVLDREVLDEVELVLREGPDGRVIFTTDDTMPVVRLNTSYS